MKKILVIDDAPDIREIIRDTLQSKEWQVLLAEDGEEGIALANQHHPDLVLCDVCMPKMDGYAVLQTLRKSTETALVPFIFLSGMGERPQIRHGMDLGADDYLLKPFTPTELITAVEARLRKHHAISKSTELKLNRLRESLSVALSHELGTPLNTILGFSSLIADASELSAKEIREFAGYIHASGKRLRELIEKFLLFAQLELIASDPAQIDVLAQKNSSPTKETIITAAERCALERERADDLILEVTEMEHRVGAAHLERMVRELVANACQFSPAGTKIKISSAPKNGSLELVVTDRGKGFSGEQIDRVTANLQFDRRFQEQQGVGLGLAITRKLAEIYGGSLRIVSTPGAQTEVHINLPV